MVSRLVVIAALVLAPVSVAAGPRKATRIDVTGTYDSNWGEVRLVQHGTLVEGEYVCCGGGRIQGRLEGRVLSYYWVEAERGADGHGVWRVVGTALVGTWGSDASEDDGGEWNLRRVDSQVAN